MSSSFAYNTDAVSTNSSAESYTTGGGASSTGFGGGSSGSSAFYPGPGAGQSTALSTTDQYAKQSAYGSGAHPALYSTHRFSAGYSHLDPTNMAATASLLGYPHQSLNAAGAGMTEESAVPNYCNPMGAPFYSSQSMLTQPQYFSMMGQPGQYFGHYSWMRANPYGKF